MNPQGPIPRHEPFCHSIVAVGKYLRSTRPFVPGAQIRDNEQSRLMELGITLEYWSIAKSLLVLSNLAI